MANTYVCRLPCTAVNADGYTVPQAPVGSPDGHQFYILKRNICVASDWNKQLVRKKGGALMTSVLFWLKRFRRTKLCIHDNFKGGQRAEY